MPNLEPADSGLSSFRYVSNMIQALKQLEDFDPSEISKLLPPKPAQSGTKTPPDDTRGGNAGFGSAGGGSNLTKGPSQAFPRAQRNEFCFDSKEGSTGTTRLAQIFNLRWKGSNLIKIDG